MPEDKEKKICFIHYGIGWRDGVNTVLTTLVSQIKKQKPDLRLCFLGGEIERKIIKDAQYRKISDLLPKKRRREPTKRELQKKSKIIAQKIAQKTKDANVVVIENPFLGTYHLSAMLGFSLYASQYKPKGVKVFFRVHDLYSDSPHYFKNLEKLFSAQEIRDIVRGKGVDGFIVIDRVIRTNLIKAGVPRKKIFYLPNSVDSRLFAQKLSKKERQLLYQILRVPDKGKKKAKMLVYPVRVVPRKNIEEAILLTYFIRELTGDNYILVISGKVDENDRLSRDYYNALKELKALVKFPIIFKKGSLPSKRQYFSRRKIKEFSIADLYNISSAIVMTSLREGFGYPFLECWFAKKIVIGRRTPSVISTFEKYGFKFSWLYRSFVIPEQEPIKKEIENYFEKVTSRVKWLYESFLIPKKVFLRVEKEEYLQRVRKVINLFKNPELKKKALDLNKAIIAKQVRILQNKKRQREIIKANLEVARKFYEIRKNTKQFLKLVGIE